ncbi:alpha/beta hydrolase [bacterium]|nr:MAG: alpha/beta hydrolase [bacterium]
MELVTFETSDGLSLDGAWYPNHGKHYGAIILHGKGQNFYSAVGRWLAPYLSTLGISSLAINMRDHDHRELSSVELADNDIAAAVNFLHEKGIDQFLLIANSYGSNKAALFLSNEQVKNRMIGLVLLSAGGSKTDSPVLWKQVLENLREILCPYWWFKQAPMNL